MHQSSITPRATRKSEREKESCDPGDGISTFFYIPGPQECGQGLQTKGVPVRIQWSDAKSRTLTSDIAVL